jgi:hypothetical protein
MYPSVILEYVMSCRAIFPFVQTKNYDSRLVRVISALWTPSLFIAANVALDKNGLVIRSGA